METAGPERAEAGSRQEHPSQDVSGPEERLPTGLCLYYQRASSRGGVSEMDSWALRQGRAVSWKIYVKDRYLCPPT